MKKHVNYLIKEARRVTKSTRDKALFRPVRAHQSGLLEKEKKKSLLTTSTKTNKISGIKAQNKRASGEINTVHLYTTWIDGHARRLPSRTIGERLDANSKLGDAGNIVLVDVEALTIGLR
jgi:hypothetical protein